MFSARLKALAVLAIAGAWACGGGGGGTDNPIGPTPGAPVTITIVGDRGAQSFSPNPATAAGRMVVFRNTDTQVHRVRLNNGALDTGDIAPGATSQAVLMPASGTNYHCTLHTGMIGAVQSESAPPPVCEGQYC
jgi:plastocyanin